jgi:hypothetical protein
LGGSAASKEGVAPPNGHATKVLSFYCGVDVSSRQKSASTAGSVTREWLVVMATGLGSTGGGVEGVFDELDAILVFCDFLGFWGF